MKCKSVSKKSPRYSHLPWFERLWYALANHPILLAVLAVLAAISVILLAWVLWRLLRIISRRRLNPDNE